MKNKPKPISRGEKKARFESVWLIYLHADRLCVALSLYVCECKRDEKKPPSYVLTDENTFLLSILYPFLAIFLIKNLQLLFFASYETEAHIEHIIEILPIQISLELDVICFKANEIHQWINDSYGRPPMIFVFDMFAFANGNKYKKAYRHVFFRHWRQCWLFLYMLCLDQPVASIPTHIWSL